MTGHALIPHHSGAVPPGRCTLVANVELVGPVLRFSYRLRGELAAIAIPHRVPARRAERLWEHTCFEAFVAPGAGERYFELNFSPSTEWAAYELDGYRRGQHPLALVRPPAIEVAASGSDLRVTAALVSRPWSRIGPVGARTSRSSIRGQSPTSMMPPRS